MAHRDRSHFGGRPSLSGHNGHGWSGGRLDPDANGPNLPMLVGQSNICSARLFQTSDLFRYCEGIIYLDPEVPDGAFDLGVAEQELSSPTSATKSANSGLMHRSKQFRYLITSATRCESYRELEAGPVRVSFDAVRIISSLAAR